MQVFKSAKELKSALAHRQQSGESVGFVPTMGALHEGHLSLVRKACEENEICVCSIFVNPIQFNDKKDLEKYPRDLEGDLRLLESTRCEFLFYPDADEIYPDGIPAPLTLGNIECVLEGKYRPGHFSGVSTVVKRLFEIVAPNKAYFGLKDYQQYLVIKTMVRETGLDVEVVGCETKREDDGLAMSSRNRLLSEEGRRAALLFNESLKMAKKNIHSKSLDQIRAEVGSAFEHSDQCDLEYFEIVDAEDLTEKDTAQSPLIACIAGYVEGVRLIDNLILIP